MVVKLTCRLLMTFFYRRIVSTGVPYSGHSCFWICNHPNGIIDPVMVLAQLPVHVRPVSKHTLYANPIMAFFLWLVDAIPIYRTKDLECKGNPKVSYLNVSSFQAISTAILKGECILLFPEGISHEMPHLAEFRSGLVRMIRKSFEDAGEDGNLTVFVQPVVLDFEEKDQFRSDLFIHYCDPISVSSIPTDLQGFMKQVRRSMKAFIPNFISWEERRDWFFAFQLLHKCKPGDLREFRKFVADKPERLGFTHPFGTQVSLLRLKLTTHGINGVVANQIFSNQHGFVPNILCSIFWMIFAPFATLSFLLWGIPFYLCSWIATRLTNERDVIATLKVANGFWLVPLWVLVFSIAGTLLNQELSLHLGSPLTLFGLLVVAAILFIPIYLFGFCGDHLLSIWPRVLAWRCLQAKDFEETKQMWHDVSKRLHAEFFKRPGSSIRKLS